MKVSVKIDKDCLETEVIIVTNEVGGEVNEIMNKLSKQEINKLIGSADNKVVVIKDDNLIRIYSNNQKVHAVTNEGEYILKFRLYELEERLDNKKFIRISNSEIVNVDYIQSFDLSFTGTIGINFTTGERTFASRRHVSKIKKLFGL